MLVTVVGAGIGESAIAQQECVGFNIARAVAKLPIREFDARYVQLWLTTNRAIGWMKRDAREVARPTLNLQQLQTLPVPIPPLAEQHLIVAEVEARTTAIDHLEAELDRQITRSNRLRQSTLGAAFSDQL